MAFTIVYIWSLLVFIGFNPFYDLYQEAESAEEEEENQRSYQGNYSFFYAFFIKRYNLSSLWL